MAKSKKEVSDKAEDLSRFYFDRINDFKTPYVTPGIIGDVITNRFTENPLNSSRKEVNEKQLRYFHDISKFNFKHGLEATVDENGDEDPVIFGFDIIINTQTSPLFGGSTSDNILEFFNFADREKIKEILNRRAIYDDFIEHFSKFFDRTDSTYSNIKSFYLKSVENIGELINKATAIHDKKQFVEYGKESENIKLTMYEDTHLNAGYLAMLYNTFSYSKINGKQIIPENLLRFDMSIIISEIRSFNKVLHSLQDGDDIMNIVNDNISRYKYNLYDCQFNFDKMSHPDTLKNEETQATTDYTFNIYYKFVTLEMEKFNLKIGEEDLRKYINNEEADISSRLYNVGQSSPSLTDIKYRSNSTPYISFDNGGEIGNNVNTFLTPSVPPSGEGVEKSEIDMLKDENLVNGDIIEDVPKTGIAAIIKNTKDFAIQSAKMARDRLINNTLQKIRTNTGLRRISSPINVYNSAGILNFVAGQIRDFANTNLTAFIQKSPVGNIPINDIKTLNAEYNNRIHNNEFGGGITDFDDPNTIL